MPDDKSHRRCYLTLPLKAKRGSHWQMACNFNYWNCDSLSKCASLCLSGCLRATVCENVICTTYGSKSASQGCCCCRRHRCSRINGSIPWEPPQRLEAYGTNWSVYIYTYHLTLQQLARTRLKLESLFISRTAIGHVRAWPTLIYILQRSLSRGLSLLLSLALLWYSTFDRTWGWISATCCITARNTFDLHKQWENRKFC